MNEIQTPAAETDKPQDPDELVELKNGAKVPRSVVSHVMSQISKLTFGCDDSSSVILIHELVMKSRNDKHFFFDRCQWKLSEHGFLDTEGLIKGYVRDIVLSAATGEGIKIVIGSPLKD